MNSKSDQKGKNIILKNSKLLSGKARRAFVDGGWLVATIVLISVLVNVSLRLDVQFFETNLSETSLTELLQILLLVMIVSVFINLSKKVGQLYHASVLIAGFFSALAIRELDHWFDKISHGFWLYPALLVSGVAIYIASKGRKETLEELAEIIDCLYGKLLIISVMLLLVFSRLYGMGSFWRSVMGADFSRDVKNISEEGIELLCYFLICFSAIKIYQYFSVNNK
ncbi:hypothetical protein BIY21_04500 [Vibrio ponticus]|uniref:TRAP transporter small permease n=1 Tax=Vibrio ponticus TaxID=265668 RepID=A0ABX3F617_9VIBR|nr:hypothetical protein [Vibrio ponticus]OLQ85503.1 hypothetical protein BIY21_04500 [Vibrio ponticus]